MITPFVTPSSRSYDLEASLRQSTLLRMDMQGQRIPGCFFTLPIGMQGEANESKPKVNAREAIPQVPSLGIYLLAIHL